MKRPAPEAIPEPQGPPKHPRIHPPVAIPAYPKPTRAVAGYVPAGSPVAKPNGPAPAAPGQAGTGTARPTSRAGAGAAQELEMYVVATIGDDGHEAAMKTLIGEYVEKGENHGRKVFQKVIPQGRSDIIDVLIYYWDGRDGDAFSGWWFGNKLGGSQVWAQCKDSGKIPPSTGWKIPWDGPVRDTLLVESKAAQMAKEAQAKLLDLTAEASALEESSKKVLEQAKLASQSGETAALADAEQELPPKVVALSELSRKVADAQRSFSGDMIKSFQQLGSQLRILQGSLNSEYTAIRSVRQKAESEEKQREQEEADTLLLEEILPEAISKTNDAEDEVEKAVITQEMIEACEEDLAMVKEAIAETESAAKAAQALVKEAKAVLTAKLAAAQRLGADSVRQKACDELGKLQEQLQIAQQKLEPLKTLRQDWDQKRRTKKTVAEVCVCAGLVEVSIAGGSESAGSVAAEGEVGMNNFKVGTPIGVRHGIAVRMANILGEASAALLVTGTAIGGGFLALPHAVAPAGFVPSVISMLGAWLFLLAQSYLAADLVIAAAASRRDSAAGSGTSQPGVAVSYNSLARDAFGMPGAACVGVLFLILALATLVSQLAKAGQMLSPALGVPHHVACAICAGSLSAFTLLVPGQVVAAVSAVLTIGFSAASAGLFAAGAPAADWSRLARADWLPCWRSMPTILQLFVYLEIVPSVCFALGFQRRRVRRALLSGSLLLLFIEVGWAALGLGLVPVTAANMLRSDPVEILLSSGGPVATMIFALAMCAISTTEGPACLCIASVFGTNLAVKTYLEDAFRGRNLVLFKVNVNSFFVDFVVCCC
ncbi:unnamed protein product [Polarella glacialis]|uniref:Uncharacterized protein n=1 Tax=Polarella glacialis TaxID=89957 RepID=A0A813GZT1_POLGL|nr:unnamed protein product [Polarella glacialis]